MNSHGSEDEGGASVSDRYPMYNAQRAGSCAPRELEFKLRRITRSSNSSRLPARVGRTSVHR